MATKAVKATSSSILDTPNKKRCRDETTSSDDLLIAENSNDKKKVKLTSATIMSTTVTAVATPSPAVKTSNMGRNTPPLRREKIPVGTDGEYESKNDNVMPTPPPPSSLVNQSDRTIADSKTAETTKNATKTTDVKKKVQFSEETKPAETKKLQFEESKSLRKNFAEKRVPLLGLLLCGLMAVLFAGAALFSVSQIGALRTDLERMKIKSRQGVAHWKQVANQAELQLEGY